MMIAESASHGPNEPPDISQVFVDAVQANNKYTGEFLRSTPLSVRQLVQTYLISPEGKLAKGVGDKIFIVGRIAALYETQDAAGGTVDTLGLYNLKGQKIMDTTHVYRAHEGYAEALLLVRQADKLEDVQFTANSSQINTILDVSIEVFGEESDANVLCIGQFDTLEELDSRLYAVKRQAQREGRLNEEIITETLEKVRAEALLTLGEPQVPSAARINRFAVFAASFIGGTK